MPLEICKDSCYDETFIFFIGNEEFVKSRSSRPEVFYKEVVLKISKKLTENTCARVSFLIKVKVSDLRPVTLLKKRLWHWCFPVNSVKFLKHPIL